MLAAVYEAARDVQLFCEARNWRFCFIGGVAVQRWGEPRQTKDADLTLLTGFGDELKYINELLAAYAARRDDAREFALANRVLLLRHQRGVPLDFALGAFPFEENSIQRSSLWEAAPGVMLRTCCAEDLVVHKAFANRNIDWADVERIIQRQGRRLDIALIRRELAPLVELKEEPEILAELESIVRNQLT